MGYLTAADMESAGLGLDEALLTQLIETASTLVDQHCGRSFTATAESEARIFDAHHSRVAFIDDLLVDGNEAVEYDDGTGAWVAMTAGENYWLKPWQGSPKIRVELYETTSRIRVTGIWGYSEAVPQGIKTAVRLIVMRLAQRAMQAYATKREGIGDYSITYAIPEDASQQGLEMVEKLVLDPYRKITH